jgi:ABC-type multidrug transport system ATPase subunit
VDHGRILAEGAPERLKQESGGTAVVDAALAGDHTAARAALSGVTGVRDVQPTERGLRILVAPDNGGVPRVVSIIAEHHLTDLKVVEPSLETVFIGLTGRDLRE